MIYLDYSMDLQERITPEKYPVQPTEKIILMFGKQEEIVLTLHSVRRSFEELFSAVSVWEAVVYRVSDFSVLCKTQNAEIDSSRMSEEGVVSFLLNTKTSNFLNSVREQSVHGFLELRGFNPEEEMIHSMRFRILGQYSSDPHGAVPEEIYDDIATMSWVKDYLSGDGLKAYVTQDMLETALDDVSTPPFFPVTVSEGTVIPLVHNSVIKHQIQPGQVLQFETEYLPEHGCITMELWLFMPETAVSFSMPDVVWIEDPMFDSGSTLYAVVVRWDGEKVLANTAYTLEVS